MFVRWRRLYENFVGLVGVGRCDTSSLHQQWRNVMRYLCLFTGDNSNQQPTQEQMAQMGALVEQSKRDGKLVATGGLKKRETDGFIVRRAGDKYMVENGGARWASA